MTLEHNSVEIKFTCVCESQLTQMRRYWVPRYVGVLVGFFVLFFFVFQVRVSLCSLDYLGANSGDWAGLKLRVLSDSQGLWACLH